MRNPSGSTLPTAWWAMLAFILSALWVTWPLATQMSTALPVGAYDNATVTLAQAWALDHMADKALGGFRDYWQAPIFHPSTGTFALSEAGPVSALIAAPMRLFSDGPGLGYNTVVLAAMALNGWAAWFLMRSLGLSSPPAMVTGLLVQLVPSIHLHLGVLPLLHLWPVLLTIAALLRWLQRPTRASAVWMGLMVAVTYLCCFHYGLLLVVILLPAGAALLRRRHLRAEVAASLCLSAAVTLLVIAPVAYGQWTWLHDAGFQRGEQSVERLAVNPLLALQSPWELWFKPWFVTVTPGPDAWYPGTLRVVVAGVGAWFGSGNLDLRTDTADTPLRVSDRPTTEASLERGTLLLGVAFVSAWAIASAPSLSLGELSLYDVLVSTIPGFGQIRNLSRAAMLAQLLLILLTGIGLGVAWQWVRRQEAKGRQRAFGAAWAVLAILAVFEMPLPRGSLYPLSSEMFTPTWTAWLADNTPEDAVLVLFPEPPTPYPPDYEPVAELMVLGRTHHRAMIGGYSSYFPADYRRVRPELMTFPSVAAIQAALQVGATHAVVYLESISETRIEESPGAAAGLERLFSDPVQGVAIYRLLSVEDAEQDEPVP